jgi:hypothetical protein
MSAAPQLPLIRSGGSSGFAPRECGREWKEAEAARTAAESLASPSGNAAPVSLAFYRKHSESTLRRYLYASMQVGRTPSILGDPVGRGWASSRTVRTFEDALIFVLDVERCLDKLDSFDRLILSRIVLQDYTQIEAAGMLGMSARAIGYKFGEALDSLTEKLLASDLLLIPEGRR